ncbi:MAG: hypothetical protein ABFS24_13400 [Pseudomonadota bacterium]
MKLTFALLVAAACVTPMVLAADDWRFEIEPYLMASNIEGDAGVGRVTGADVDVSFSDILENLRIGAMIHGEALHASGWGLILDYGFMDLENDRSGRFGGVIDASVRQGVFEAFAFRRIGKGANTFDLYGGVRWWDNDIKLVVDPAITPGSRRADVDEDWVDPVIGARLTTPLSDRWSLMVRGDIGGFGIASDFTTTLAAGVKYRISDSIVLDVQYKGLWVDYEDGTSGTPGYFNYDTVTHGPIIGIIFEF